MHRVTTGLIALAVSMPGLTCDQVPASPTEGAPGALVALDLEPLILDLERGGCGEASLQIGDAPPLSLPVRPSGLEAHAAVPAPADGALSLRLTTAACGDHARTAPVELAAQAVTPARPRLDADTLRLTSAAPVALPADARFAVTWADPTRAPADVPATPARAGEALAALLADPAVASVAPFTARASAADRLGALAAPRAAVRAPAPRPPAMWLDLDPDAAAEAPRRPAAAVVPAFLYYFSYCDCARPAPGRAFSATLADGRVLTGRTDRFGMIVLPGVEDDDVAIDMGPGSRERARAYPFAPDAPGFEAAVLEALASADPNERLTALLDLRARPLPAAVPALEALLEHPDVAAWLNAAVTLSRHPEAADLARRWAPAAWQSGADVARVAAILGGLRQPTSVPVLAGLLQEGPPEARPVAAWALGVIASPEGRPALEAALRSGDAALADEARLALERVAGAEAR